MAAFPPALARTTRVALDAAQGRTLAAPVRALEDVPPFTRARVDGYAVVAADVEGCTHARPARLAVVGEIAMGQPARGAVARGQAMRISTGGAMPAGADAAVMVEDTREAGGTVEVFDADGALEHVTRAGSDVAAGDFLFDPGTVLTPAKVGLIAAAGVADVLAFEPPRVALLLTGDELVPPGAPMSTGEIRDINRFSLAAALRAFGFVPVAYERVPDDRDALARAFARSLAECDAVVISGGSSAGDRDHTPEVVAGAGAPGVVVHRIRVKPGRPTLLGAVGGKPVLGLPGNPVSALVMLETVGKPILLRMLGRTAHDVPHRARLARPIRVSPELEHRIPVRLVRDGEGVAAEPYFGTSAQMHILGFADALVTVPIGVGEIAAGTTVDAFPFSALQATA